VRLLDLLITVAAGAAALGGVVFLVRYPVRTGGAWKRHPWGVHVMLFTVALVLLELQPVAFRLFGDWPWREPLLLALMVGLVGAHWHRVVLNERDLQPRQRGRHVMTDQSPGPAPVAPSSRPRPVLLLAALVAGLNALALAGDAANVIPGEVFKWIVVASIFVTAFGAVLVQGAVTPLSDPRNSAGQPLAPIGLLQAPVRAAARAGAIAGAADAIAAAGLPAAEPDPVDDHADTTVREPARRASPFDDDWPGRIAR
jgi:hypothetical protein